MHNADKPRITIPEPSRTPSDWARRQAAEIRRRADELMREENEASRRRHSTEEAIGRRVDELRKLTER